MIGRRVRPLQALLAAAGAVLGLRLFWVQVKEHELWSFEAARLVHAGREIPYRRGRILDAQGRVLARDTDFSTVALVYRDFRRGHPLGQVAHARSLLEGRPVGLAETRLHLRDWARELVSLTPEDWRAFARGEGRFADPASTLDERERAQRAANLGFYLQRLLGLDGRLPLRALWEDAGDGFERRSFLELAAGLSADPRARGGARRTAREASPAAVQEAWTALEERLARSLLQLDRLAPWVAPAGDAADAPASADPCAWLVAELERARRWVEDATASKLFAEAAGFAPGRLEPPALLALDQAWIAELLAWDAARVAEWAETVREAWTRTWRDEQALPRLVWDLVLEPAAEPGPSEFLDRLAQVFAPEGALERALDGAATPWSELDELAVFASLPDVLAAGPERELVAARSRCLPIQSPELRGAGASPDLLDAVAGAGEDLDERVRAHLAGRRASDVDGLLAIAGGLVRDWDARFQAALRGTLDEIARAADGDELSADGKLLLAADRRERASERAEFFLKDYGTRPRPLLSGEPPYDVIYLLTRYEADFAGFQARRARAREAATFLGDDERPAAELVGRVSAPAVNDLLRQRREAGRLRALKTLPERSEREEEELARLIGEVLLADEVKGVSGIEALYDQELTGKNGYAETRGLEDVFGAGAEEIPVGEPEDGLDVTLTLDVDLQRAAQRSLRRPEVPDDPERDDAWLAEPVGAIVLLSSAGDVLAAASEPDEGSTIGPSARGERERRIERTLTKPKFQPPGSVFKAFVAAWALDHGLDPARTVTCAPLEGGGYGYKDLRCWNQHGHGVVALEEALVQSCNAYFAWLGETIPAQEFQALAREFGFGAPTGVRAPPPWDAGLRKRGGLSEHTAGLTGMSRSGELTESQRRMTGNGLGAVEATPMQLARAMLALATGTRRALRLVRAVGGRELPPAAASELELSERSLEFVREALERVASDAHGTAHTALAPDVLGIPLAVKTGSADLTSREDADGRRKVQKHTWVGGWIPPEDPRCVFVVFEHDTSATSSHGAVYLARQFLRQPEVLRWLAQAGVDVSAAETPR